MRGQITYQIYTYGQAEQQNAFDREQLLKWGLHAESDHKEAIMLHAKMLNLDPEYQKIQIEKIYFDDKTGEKRTKTIKVLQKQEKKTLISRFKGVFSFF